MTRSRSWILATLLTALGAGLAQADDKAANLHFRKAVRAWNDPDTSKAAAAFAKASSEATSPAMRIRCMFYEGQFHQAKTGNFKRALEVYAKVVKEGLAAGNKQLKGMASAAQLSIGAIKYTESLNHAQALKDFGAALKIAPNASAHDFMSQVHFRVGRDKKLADTKRREHLMAAEKSARAAVKLLSQMPLRGKRAIYMSKLRLQLTIVLAAQGLKAQADREWKQIEPHHLNNNTLYQLAILHSVQNKSAADVARSLRRALSKKLRPKAKARNQLRRMIKSEPDLAKFLSRPDWKDIATAEKEKPTSRPSR